MPCSPEQLAANRKNAGRSSGPKTEAGKSRSRANGLKHGLTGEGVVVPPVDAAEVGRRTSALEAELKPSGVLGMIHVARLAALSVRLERSVRNELAAVAERVRNAAVDLDESRLAEARRRLEAIADDPATTVRWLRRTPEGVDALIGSLLERKAILNYRVLARWNSEESDKLDHLTGRASGGMTPSRIRALGQATWGHFGDLRPEEAAGRAEPELRAWARERLADLIDDEVAKLREHRESLDPDAIDRERLEAADRALFDPSREATLARKYEAATERSFYRALRELREAEEAARPEAETTPETSGDETSVKLGSSCPARPEPVPTRPGTPSRPSRAPAGGAVRVSRPLEKGRARGSGD